MLDKNHLCELMLVFWPKIYFRKCFPHYLAFGTMENQRQLKTFYVANREQVYLGGKHFLLLKGGKRFPK